MAKGTHDHAGDPRNDDILIWVNGELKPRAEAVVSVFDSGFVLGDGVWEGLRVHDGHPAFLEKHLDRLFQGAQAILMDLGMTPRGDHPRRSTTRSRPTTCTTACTSG